MLTVLESVVIPGLWHCLIIEPTTITKTKTTAAATTIELRATATNAMQTTK